ncbi:MAG TPA: GreA/GreB family elongation factor [Caulobacteraceae bacterium]|nr:GreA/GreB family elongation factor [Caulobacteraceae bacterium]
MNEPLARPSIFISVSDAERLVEAARRAKDPTAPAAQLLVEELARAHVCANDDVPARVVRIGSRVRYRDNRSGAAAEVRIVLPEDAEPERGKVSVLDITGAALIGVPEDQCFRWRDGDGELQELEVVQVLDDFVWR